jgi:vacuolar-type H+-ATPase subunit E/Vma4
MCAEYSRIRRNMISEVELKEIRSLLQKLNKKVDGLNDLVEERLIGCQEPTKEDVAAIEEYEATEKNRKLSLVPLSELAKGI